MYWNGTITVLKVDNYKPCTTDLEGSKTQDFCDPRLGKSIKTNPQKIVKSCCKSIVILQTAHFLKPGALSGCKEEEETMLFEVV